MGDRGLSDLDAFEINNVYTLAKHCKNKGLVWAYSNGKRCRGDTGNCIRKPNENIQIPRGTTCFSKRKMNQILQGKRNNRPRTKPVTDSPRTNMPTTQDQRSHG